MESSEEVLHPGIRIRAEVIPAGMSVTKAAQLMGVGRPALSNLLNGNASLSAEMAARLETAFKVPRTELMEMQARYDAAQAQKKGAPANIPAYVPPFLAIKANDIEAWASKNIQARSRMAVLLRTLVHSTGRGLTKVDFPGNDDAQRKGSDGIVDANEGSPWVPAGRSIWEFGTDQDVKRKASDDFDKSLDATSATERADITYVFVSPRRWPGKEAWLKEKKNLGLWKDVVVYDSNDLEQWLEQSLSGQAWFANETQSAAQDVRSLDKCWADWANVAKPPLSGMLFNSAVDASKRSVSAWLAAPSEGSLVIAADSHEEGLAFLAQLLSEEGELETYRDRVLVFDKPGVFPRLATAAQTFIAVTYSPDVEREFAPYARSMHTIVIYPRNAAPSKPDVTLEPASHDSFSTALDAMGKSRDEITRLTSDTGRSLTVLRRQLSTLHAVRVPKWAADHHLAAKLVPFLLVGAWDSTNDADKHALSELAGGRSYEDLEKDCQSLTLLDDAPIWSIGLFRGVVSKIDLLHAIAGIVTQNDLTKYFAIARQVLGEDDPALDLEESERWAASIHGKTRQFSSAFREGISETLVLLAVQGSQLFKQRLGFDTEVEASRVIWELLPEPLTARALEANDRDLPLYAEAAPDAFLSILERDLRTDSPASVAIMRPVSSSDFFGSPRRTGLLWALEGLAWNPDTLPRVALILARLANFEINDNRVNKPINSLESIFRAWMPQTAANHDQRVAIVKMLAAKFPEVAWKICVAQFGNTHQIGHHSHKPRWRADGYGYGEPFPTWGPIHAFQREMVELALGWGKHSLETLSDLVERMQYLSPEHQVQAWGLVEAWGNGIATDEEKGKLREKIRTSALSRRAAIRSKKKGVDAALANSAKAAYQALEPVGLVNRHLWLFKSHWIDESADEIEEIEKFDYREREERIRNLRVSALREVHLRAGPEGVLELASRGGAPWTVGILTPVALTDISEVEQLLNLAFSGGTNDSQDANSYMNVVSGALHSIEDDSARLSLIESLESRLSETQAARLLMLAPYSKATWSLVDKLGSDGQQEYWTEVRPNFLHGQSEEMQEGVERLLIAGRPRAAFRSIEMNLENVTADALYRLMSMMVKDGNDKPGEYQLDPYHIEQAFKRLEASSKFTIDQMASLEFAYLEALRRPGDRKGGYGIPNLERYVESNPDLFAQAVAWTYRRGDGKKDPEQFRVPADRAKDMASRGYHLLEAIHRIPGHDPTGKLNAKLLANWIKTVREICSELDRTVVADLAIGGLLAHAPVGEDGVWPCEPVRDTLEELQSEDVMRGAHTGIYNSHGVHWRGEGGSQERELAKKYRSWARALQISHPFVASSLLMGLAATYEHEASREDTAATLRHRLR